MKVFIRRLRDLMVTFLPIESDLFSLDFWLNLENNRDFYNHLYLLSFINQKVLALYSNLILKYSLN